MEPDAQAFIKACKGFRWSVHVLVSMSRAFWRLCSNEKPRAGRKKKDFYRRIASEDLRRSFVNALEHPDLDFMFDTVVDRMISHNICWKQNGELTLRRSVANPLDLIRLMLRGARPDPDLKYFVMENARCYYRFVQSAAAAHQFHVLSAAINELVRSRSADVYDTSRVHTWDLNQDLMAGLDKAIQIEAGADTGAGPASPPAEDEISLSADVLRRLNTVLNRDFAIPMRVRDLFLECCRVVNYIRLSDRIGFIELSQVDPDGSRVHAFATLRITDRNRGA